jgi:hypothetical protein
MTRRGVWCLQFAEQRQIEEEAAAQDGRPLARDESGSANARDGDIAASGSGTRVRLGFFALQICARATPIMLTA